MRATRPRRKPPPAAAEMSAAVARPALVERLFSPVDVSVLAYFRIVFGALMCAHLTSKLASGAVTRDYVEPAFHFTYFGFDWVRPLAGGGMQILFALLAICSLLLALGLFYRFAAIAFTAGSSYVFLIDRAYYLNHEYLICLLGLLLIFLPCHKVCSVDAWLRPRLRGDSAPAWTLWLLRFQIALPYVFGGIAKLNPDWLRGQPMRSWLPESPIPHLVGPIGAGAPAAMFMSWGGLLLDLFVVPLLLWKRTRLLALIAVLFFHLTNAVMLDIGIFPWLMIGATFVFFPADWPRKLLKPKTTTDAGSFERTSRRKRRLVLVLLGAYALVHVLLPFRHLLHPGNPSWTEEGNKFAWRMMLRDKNTALQLLQKHRETAKVVAIDPRRWLTPDQIEAMGQDPDMLREFAHFVADRLHEQGVTDVSIHVVAIASLNGRKPQFLVDPRVNLATIKFAWGHNEWIFPLKQPFRWDPWNVPMIQWLENVDDVELLEEI